ncbi:NACHT domain-containing protein [Clostridium beijerinckii]|uniref:NACHT domain-containing protein n=1 Tax=Clostridium beijerinckii TaxID=1520 RepID=A0AAX0AW55_CLOBE|nr:NACHT domain-containing protein [Clostridium beijerinckii]NRT87285.1 hypothetical protein [Clostridium beijerinckii]NYC72716.1 hypothetical protein [Clostridium beijerinckii]
MFEEYIIDIIKDLITSVIDKNLNKIISDHYKIRKIKNRIDDTIVDVIDALRPFLKNEGVSEERQKLLIQTCVNELREFMVRPELLFNGSLNGQKIFEDLYSKNGLPEVIIEEELNNIYAILFPRIATLVCKIPEVISNWQNEVWAENFKRFDEITDYLQNVMRTVDEIKKTPERQADDKLNLIRMALAQKIRFDLDLTGLRGDRPMVGNFNDFFVHPQISETNKKSYIREINTAEESISNFIYKREHAIIIAPPGGGKSTWSKWLQRELLSTKWNGIVVRYELRRFSTDSMLTLYELIRDIVGKHFSENLKTEYIDEWLKSNKIAIILDGFDEIRPNDRDSVFEWIVDLNVVANGCPLIITSRPITTDHFNRLGSEWSWWSIQPFDNSRIVDYIERWYKYTPLLGDNNRIINGEELSRTWKNDPTIEPLTSNPLLLSTLLMVHHLDGSIPNGRSQLYKRYIDGMLGIWDDRRDVNAVDIKLSLIQKKQILKRFAIFMFFEEEDQIDETKIIVWLNNLLDNLRLKFKAEEVLSQLRERSGLIIGPGIYSFIHKTVGEYLVAEEILDGDYRLESGMKVDRFCLFENRENDRWNSVIFLWSGIAPVYDVESFIEQCIKMDDCELGYGILLDQYVRLSPEFCYKIILGEKYISKINTACDFGCDSFWICSSSYVDKYGYVVPDFELKSINDYNTFSNILSKMIHDNIITIKNYLNVSGKLKELIWMTLISDFNTIEIWSEALTYIPFENNKIKWIYWSIEQTIGKVCMHTRENLRKVIEMYKSVCPEANGVLPIGLISIALNRKSQNDREAYIYLVKNIIHFLPNCSKEEINNEWLISTEEWLIDSLDNENAIDLLEEFKNELIVLANTDKGEADDLYNSAINYIIEIIKLRRSLMS